MRKGFVSRDFYHCILFYRIALDGCPNLCIFTKLLPTPLGRWVPDVLEGHLDIDNAGREPGQVLHHPLHQAQHGAGAGEAGVEALHQRAQAAGEQGPRTARLCTHRTDCSCLGLRIHNGGICKFLKNIFVGVEFVQRLELCSNTSKKNGLNSRAVSKI